MTGLPPVDLGDGGAHGLHRPFTIWHGNAI